MKYRVLLHWYYDKEHKTTYPYNNWVYTSTTVRVSYGFYWIAKIRSHSYEV